MSVLDSFRLDGRRALVTGGGRGPRPRDGTGAGRSRRRRRHHQSIRREREPRRRPRSPPPPGAPSAATPPTCRRAPTITRLADEVEDTLGPVDILVNNAGINVRGASDQLAEADWDAVIDTNLKGPVPLRAAVRPAHGRARMGPRDQPRIDPQRHRTARAGRPTRRRRPASPTSRACSRSSGPSAA